MGIKAAWPALQEASTAATTGGPNQFHGPKIAFYTDTVPVTGLPIAIGIIGLNSYSIGITPAKLPV